MLIEPGAGTGSGFRDEDYTKEGASLQPVDAVWAQAELILKVKEPIRVEYPRLRSKQILFTYLHLAAVPDLTRALQKSGTIAIAYETVQRADGSLPLLTPMSEVAGRLSVQEGAYHLGKAHGGRGILLSGVPGVPPGNVVILGAGTVGLNAVRMAVGLGGDVSVLDVNVDRLRHVDDLYRGQVVTVVSNAFNIARLAQRADLLVGAVLVAGARAPILVPESTVKTMKEGSVIVDVAVDQGGCVETMHPTTLADPIYLRARRRPLRRGQHARPRAPHLHVRAHQRDPALHRGARREGRRGGAPREPRAGEGAQRLPGPHRPSRRGRVRGREGDAARERARLTATLDRGERTADDSGFSPENVDLGTLRVGEPANGDAQVGRRPQLSFVWRVVKAITHPRGAEQVVAYPAPPTGPAGEQVKALSVRSLAPDCGIPRPAAMDAWIDNVAVNAPRAAGSPARRRCETLSAEPHRLVSNHLSRATAAGRRRPRAGERES